MPKRNDQKVGAHGARPNAEDTQYSKYVTGEVCNLQDQSDSGGWIPQGMPINAAEIPDLDTKMGTRGSFKDAAKYDTDDL